MPITTSTNTSGSGDTKTIDVDVSDPGDPGGAPYDADVFLCIEKATPLSQKGAPADGNPTGHAKANPSAVCCQWCDVHVTPGNNVSSTLTYQVKGVQYLQKRATFVVVAVKHGNSCGARQMSVEWGYIDPTSIVVFPQTQGPADRIPMEVALEWFRKRLKSADEA